MNTLYENCAFYITVDKGIKRKKRRPEKCHQAKQIKETMSSQLS